jgi:hypothetical protein
VPRLHYRVGVPKRNRANEQRKAGGPPVVAAPVIDEKERAAKLFVESIRAHEVADLAEKQRKQDAADHAARHVELQEAKDAAAAQIKRLRATEGRREQIADAEAAYRVALAELTEFETGERPHWAPPVPVPEQSDPFGDAAPAEDDDVSNTPL